MPLLLALPLIVLVCSQSARSGLWWLITHPFDWRVLVAYYAIVAAFWSLTA
jgi:hypothetical protein